MSVTTCINTGPGSSAFTRSSLSTSSGKQATPECCHLCFLNKIEHLFYWSVFKVICRVKCVVLILGSTMGRRLGSTSPGWASTQRCCSLQLSWASYVSPMECSVMMTTGQGEMITIRPKRYDQLNIKPIICIIIVDHLFAKSLHHHYKTIQSLCCYYCLQLSGNTLHRVWKLASGICSHSSTRA